MRRRAFTLVELMIVVGVIGVFAGVVIPRMGDGARPIAARVAEILEADLRRARTEALARGGPIVAVAAADGHAWWLAGAKTPATPIDGTERQFGRSGLAPMKGATLTITNDDAAEEAAEINGCVVFASFDALGSRDESTPAFTLHDATGASLANWTLPAGRTRLAR